jgi:hypothetical protein
VKAIARRRMASVSTKPHRRACLRWQGLEGRLAAAVRRHRRTPESTPDHRRKARPRTTVEAPDRPAGAGRLPRPTRSRNERQTRSRTNRLSRGLRGPAGGAKMGSWRSLTRLEGISRKEAGAGRRRPVRQRHRRHDDLRRGGAPINAVTGMRHAAPS